MIVYGSGNGDGNRHNHDDLPILLAGKGGGTSQTGRHVGYPRRDTPLKNLYLAMLDRMGAPAKTLRRQHGRSAALRTARLPRSRTLPTSHLRGGGGGGYSIRGADSVPVTNSFVDLPQFYLTL